ncbi:MAG: hypothetical protein ABI616_10205 [Pseudomonadota bacterium]
MPNLLLAVLLTCGIAAAAPPPECGALCGSWQLDPAASDAVEPALDQVFARFKEPRPRRMKEGSPDNLESMNKAADEAELGPLYERPKGFDLRKEITRTVTPPEKLELTARGSDMLVAIDGRKPLSLTPGEPHSRTDVYGTAEIIVDWRKEQLTVTERYDRKRQYTRHLAVRKTDGALVLTQQITRQGVPALTLHSIYRRATETALESGR